MLMIVLIFTQGHRIFDRPKTIIGREVVCAIHLPVTMLLKLVKRLRTVKETMKIFGFNRVECLFSSAIMQSEIKMEII